MTVLDCFQDGGFDFIDHCLLNLVCAPRDMSRAAARAIREACWTEAKRIK